MTNAARAIALLLFFSSTWVFACFPVPVPLAQRVSAAQWIVTGQVTEKQRLKRDAITLPEPYSLRIVLAEKLKGVVEEKEWNVDISDCGAGSAALHDTVLLFRYAESWYVMKHNPETEATIRQLLAQ